MRHTVGPNQLAKPGLTRLPTIFLILFSTIVTLSSHSSTSAQAAVYSDTNDHWASGIIEWASNAGLAQGYEDGSFQPDAPVSEAEFLALLLRSYSIISENGKGGKWHTPYYDYAIKKGWPLTFNNERGSFRRGQAALLMATAASGEQLQGKEAIQWMLDEGISRGRTSPTVSGYAEDGKVTRAEALTFIYKLKEHTGTLSITELKQNETTLFGVAIGDRLEELLYKLGDPIRMDSSEYDYSWYIFNDSNHTYHSFAMFGVLDNRIVAQFSSSSEGWLLKRGIALGQKLPDAQAALSGVTKTVKKETHYAHTDEGVTETFFLDTHNHSKIVGILRQIDGLKKWSIDSLDDKHRASMEQQLFDLVNAERAARGISLLQWDKLAGEIARAHSEDMRTRDFFNHKNLDGKTTFDRMRAAGVSFRLASENIAAGFANSIYAHYTLLNSTSGHRESLLNEQLTKLGTGIAFGGHYNIYYTQDFYRPL